MNPNKADTRGVGAAVARHSQEMLELIPIEHVGSASMRPRYQFCGSPFVVQV